MRSTQALEVNISSIAEVVKFSVTDKGVGISLDEQKKIFDRFYRVSETQQKFPGMGIGLYICREIIKNHNGTLWVDSELGSGSTFNFTLPLKDSNEENHTYL